MKNLNNSLKMSKSKSHKLQLELKDVTGIPAGLVQCKIEVAGNTASVDMKNSMSCILEEVSLTTVITISLIRTNEIIAVSRISFNAMFGEGLQGKAEKWVRLKETNPSGRDLKVKLAGSLFPNHQGKDKPHTVPAKMLSDSSYKPNENKGQDISVSKARNCEPPKCPFVTKLAISEAPQEKLVDLWKNREIFGDLTQEKSIRITLEPETFNKPGSEMPKYDISTLDVLDIAKLKEIGGFQLKKLLKTLNEEVKNSTYAALNLPFARNQLIAKVNERTEKHAEAEKLSQEILKTSSDKTKELAELLNQRKELMKVMQVEEEKYKELEIEVDGVKAAIGLATSENIRLKAECIRYGDADKVHKELQAQVKEGLTRKTNLEKAFQNSESQLKSLKDRTDAQKEKLKKEKEEIANNLKELTKRKDSVMKENNNLKKQLADVKQRMSTEQNVKQFLKEARNNNALEASKRDQTYYDLEEFIHTMQIQIEEFKNKQKALMTNRKAASQSISSLEKELENKESQIIDLKRKISEGCSNQITLEQMYCIKSDISQLIDELNKLQKIHNEGRDVILKGLDQGVEYIMKESDQVIEDTRELDSLIDNLDNKDYELDNLKIMVGEAKTRTAPYVPKIDDPVDVALSEFLNSLDEPIPIPFTRENEGIYLFGTKRIFLKLENNNIKIRVGGGYTNIEEFIEIYTSTELERQEEAIEETIPQMMESLSRFSGKSGMSPQRAARIIQGSVEAISQGSPLKATIRKKNK